MVKSTYLEWGGELQKRLENPHRVVDLLPGEVYLAGNSQKGRKIMSEGKGIWNLLVNLKETLNGLRAVFPDLSDQSIVRLAQLLVQDQAPEPPKSELCLDKLVQEHEPGIGTPEEVTGCTLSAERFTSEEVLEFIRAHFSDREFTYLEVANKMGVKRAKIVSGGISVLARKGLVRSVRSSSRNGKVWVLVK